MTITTGPGPTTPLRIARPVTDLAAAVRFWVDGAGLTVLHRVDPSGPGEHPLVFAGFPGAAWHLELVGEPGVVPAPTEEDLLVLYLGAPVPDELVERLVAAGGTRVPARNPYWDTWGVTVADPDGYRLVLSHRGWAP